MEMDYKVIHISIVCHNPTGKGLFLLNMHCWSRLAPPHAALIHPVFDVAEIYKNITTWHNHLHIWLALFSNLLICFITLDFVALKCWSAALPLWLEHISAECHALDRDVRLTVHHHCCCVWDPMLCLVVVTVHNQLMDFSALKKTKLSWEFIMFTVGHWALLNCPCGVILKAVASLFQHGSVFLCLSDD